MLRSLFYFHLFSPNEPLESFNPLPDHSRHGLSIAELMMIVTASGIIAVYLVLWAV